MGTGFWTKVRKTKPHAHELLAEGMMLKLDLGCGPKKKSGFFGIDRRPFEGVDAMVDLTKKRWIFGEAELGGTALRPNQENNESGFTLPNNSVSEVWCSHFLEHLEHNQGRPERTRFMNELWRVMAPGATATIITPHWASNRAYGDFTHADKPVSETFYFYLSKRWRMDEAPENDIEFHPDGYSCDFTFELAHTLAPSLAQRPQEEQIFALAWYKEAAQDLVAHLRAVK